MQSDEIKQKWDYLKGKKINTTHSKSQQWQAITLIYACHIQLNTELLPQFAHNEVNINQQFQYLPDFTHMPKLSLKLTNAYITRMSSAINKPTLVPKFTTHGEIIDMLQFNTK